LHSMSSSTRRDARLERREFTKVPTKRKLHKASSSRLKLTSAKEGGEGLAPR